jgi:hypothetical protein
MADGYWGADRWGEADWPEPVAVARLGIDALGVDLFSYGPGVVTWGGGTWGGSIWTTRTWKAIGCELTSAQYAWGADRSLGVLTVASGGSIQLETYDPAGILDPTNPGSPFAFDLFPGSYIRLTFEGRVICIGIIDTINYSNQKGAGSIGGTDPVGVLSNIKVVVPANPPETLRALARELVSLAGLVYVRVEADPPAGDPPVGKLETAEDGAVGLWSAISAAAIDALHYAWVGPDLLIHFRTHGDPIDRGLLIGLGGIPLLELVGQSTADGIVNDILARGNTGTTYAVSNPDSIARFGVKLIDRSTRRIPDNVTWADYVLRDRAFASLEYLPAGIIPMTREHLLQLVDMRGIDLVRIRTDLTDPPVSVDIRALGLQMEVSPDGWLAAIFGYVSSVEWAGNMVPPPPAPIFVATPNVERTALADAALALAAVGLYGVSTQLKEESITYPAGTVLDQDPNPYIPAPVGSIVRVWIDPPLPNTVSIVPAIVASDEVAALASLYSSKLLPGPRSTVQSVTVSGTVTAQTPAAGATVAEQSTVAYTVSTGPAVVTRTSSSVKCSRVTLTAAGAKQGSGAELASPAGAYNGAQNRVLIGLDASFTSATAVRRAVLRLRTSTQVNAAFGSNPKVKVQRLTQDWTEGTAATPSGTNAVIWPGPSGTSSGEIVAAVPRAVSATFDIDVTELVRPWAPPEAGGSGAINYGLRVLGYTETDSTNTTELVTDDDGTVDARPTLILTLETM